MIRIYLDNNATTPLAPVVGEAMRPWWSGQFGNAASVHWFGQRARAAVETARQAVADLMGASANEVVFTSGGTEADNLALCGIAEKQRARGNHIITSSIEHPAVLASCRVLEQRGFEITYLPVNEDGLVRVEDLRRALRSETILLSIMTANNETGVIEPIREIASVAKSNGVIVHSDAVQAAGKIPIDVNNLNVDLLSLSAHKIHGPQGIGALYVRKGIDLAPLIVGGNQERRRRAGTENIAAAVGFGCAAELAGRDALEESPRVAALRDRFEQALVRRLGSIRVNGAGARRVPNTANLGFGGVEGDALLMALDLEGIAASMGSACSSGSLEPSHVLKAMNAPDEILRGSLRFSLSKFTTPEEIDRATEVVVRVVERIKLVSSKAAT